MAINNRSLDDSRSLASESVIDRDTIYESSAQLDKETLEKLNYGLFVFSSSGNKISDAIKSGDDMSVYCLSKVNRRQTCIAFGSCPVMKFEWNFPLSLSESIKSASAPMSASRNRGSSSRNNLRDVRIYIDEDPVIKLQSPDDEVYLSTLTIESIGAIHDGKWLCNFKYFDEINEKMDRNFMQFQINVDTRDEDQECEYNDHCASGNCVNNKCACSIDYPIYDPKTGDCHVPSSLGNECEIDNQCNEGSFCDYDANCKLIAESYRNNNSSNNPRRYSPCLKTCQCGDKLIAVNLAFNQTKCSPPSILKSPCESSDQCQLNDANTFCGFNNVCECKEGRRCREPVPILCSDDKECSVDQFCRYERCVARKRIGQSCFSNDECQKSDDNLICTAAKCRCVNGFKPVSSSSATVRNARTNPEDSDKVLPAENKQCIRSTACLSHADCYDDQHCRDNACVEGTGLDQKCKSMIECRAKDANAICNYEKSETPIALNPNYFWGPVSETTPEITGVCTCRPRYKPSSGVPSVCIAEGQCTSDIDCPADSHCAGGTCFEEVGASCRTSERCVQLMKYSYCDRDSKRCQCDANYEYDSINGTCVEKECMTRMDCKNKDCINSLCSCAADKDTNVYGFCVERKIEKEPSDDGDMRGEYSFFGDLKRIFTDWTWEAYVIVAGVSFIVILMIMILIVVIRLIRIKRQIRREKSENEDNPTAQPLNSEAVTEYID